MHIPYMRSGTTFFAPLNWMWEVHSSTFTPSADYRVIESALEFSSFELPSSCLNASKKEEMSPPVASSEASKSPS